MKGNLVEFVSVRNIRGGVVESPRGESRGVNPSGRSLALRGTAARGRGGGGLGRCQLLGLITLELPRHEDLADSAAIRRFDREAQSVQVDRVAGRRHAPDAVVDEPADGVVLLGILELHVEVE